MRSARCAIAPIRFVAPAVAKMSGRDRVAHIVDTGTEPEIDPGKITKANTRGIKCANPNW